MKVKSLNRARLLATLWTAAYQAPLSMGFSQARVLEWGAIAVKARFKRIKLFPRSLTVLATNPPNI